MVMNQPATWETWVQFQSCVRIRVRKIPWKREQLPTPVFWPGESHGKMSQAGYSPCGHKELDITQQLSFSLSFYTYLWRNSYRFHIPRMSFLKFTYFQISQFQIARMQLGNFSPSLHWREGGSWVQGPCSHQLLYLNFCNTPHRYDFLNSIFKTNLFW